ncbi:hypothetical protein [Micromonospora sp. NPDC047730]|uniref:hypothetical protein n=1 Tax=Micromonospora sp. NPDC047730 TaxID=3364253 RepID=UPI00371E022C
MTSYSIYYPQSDDPQEVWRSRVETFLSGAARSFLDTAEVVTEEEDPAETEEAYAVWWHSERRGWELDAIHPDDRPRFVKRLGDFAGENPGDLALVVNQILEDARRLGHAYVHDVDTAWYRAGELYIYNSQGQGIGLWEHGDAGKRLSERIGYHPVRGFTYPPGDERGRYVQIEEI